MKSKLIALLTDFGLSDPYVGIMKGVISSIDPNLKTIDLTHLIPPGDIQSGAFHLLQTASHFSPGTVFLAVVDPGVGTNRRGLYKKIGAHIYIGPDNGLFTYLEYKSDQQAWELANPAFRSDDVSRTFHGRDIFAPAAAHAALGTPGKKFGPSVLSPVQLPTPTLVISEQRVKGEILEIDHFGNLITSLGSFHRKNGSLDLVSWIDDRKLEISSPPSLIIESRDTTLPFVSTFADIPDGSCAALIGSSGLLEIVSNRASAAELLGLVRGDRVTLNLN